MRRRIIAGKAFYQALEALDHSEETVRAGTALLLRATNYPANGQRLPGLRVHIFKSPNHPSYPPLRLFYWFDDKEIHLLHIETYELPAH